MSHHQRISTGFTLIEMLMAIAMGSTIIFIATAGIRAASQTVTATTRLSYQNHLLREGFIAACNEADFWLQVDKPGQPDRQLSRSLNEDGTGRTFTPFINSWPEGELSISFSGWRGERRVGWDPSPMTWAPFDPRTWARFNIPERAQQNSSGSRCSDLRYGNYSLFECLNPSRPIETSTGVGCFIYEPTRCRSWYANQVKGAIDALGFFGMYEYLPSHTIWAYHGENPKGAPTFISNGGMASSMIARGGWMACSDGDQFFARGRWRTTRNASVPLPNPSEDALQSFPKSGSGRSSSTDPFRTYWLVGEGIDGYGGDKNALIRNYLNCSRFDEALMRVRPAEWPDMAIDVHHYVKNGRIVNVCILNIFDAMNGARTSLPFICTGTTLRGARQQRIVGLANGGWSTYNNSNPNKIILGPTLDWKQTRSISW